MGPSAAVKALALYWMQSMVRFSVPVFFSAVVLTRLNCLNLFHHNIYNLLFFYYRFASAKVQQIFHSRKKALKGDIVTRK